MTTEYTITAERYAALANGAEMDSTEAHYLRAWSMEVSRWEASGLRVDHWLRLCARARALGDPARYGPDAPARGAPNAFEQMEARRWELSKQRQWAESAAEMRRLSGGN